MDTCPECGKPRTVCVCDRSEPAAVGVAVLVLQHPREQDGVLGTAPLLVRAVRAQRRVGLSWPNLEAALGEPVSGRWAVLWPSQLPRPLTAQEQALAVVRIGAGREGATAEPLAGIVALDGTWSQAKALWWRNPWLLKLERLVVQPKEPSIYGRTRREPRRSYVSTLEAVAEALVFAGEPESVRADLRRAMRTMVQRARDADRAGALPEGALAGGPT